MKEKPGLDGPRVPHNPVDTLLRLEKKLLRALLGPYCHPHHVQSSPYSSRLLTMLTTPEGSAAASEPRWRTMVRPWMGTNRSRGRCTEFYGAMWPRCVCGSTTSHGRREQASRRCWFGFSGWRNKGLKKHDRH